ncbi:hypothetical protein J7394_21415 [Ruegeria sp. R13_0]|uniref:hypothetical protein n=1 Tax=Ruegeria sp. R13_0 TaxID=2821099 RepID=UPI001ADA35F3|nr:hypothetical protein [Ruegeria sp. R13_0]MBO9436774.1 hypothetical protein [Ruegeria sp. R13_0]
MAWAKLQGDPYYAGLVEQNWPGKMYLHEWAVRLFGAKFWTWRAFDFVLMQVATMGGAILLWRAGLAWAPWIFVVLYPLLYVTTGGWFAGQRDIVAAGLLIIAAALVIGPRQARGRPNALWSALLAGGLIAASVLVRPTYLSYLSGVIVLEFLKFPNEPERPLSRSLSRVGALIIGFAAVILLAVGDTWMNDALDDFYRQTLLFNIEVYPVSEGRVRLISDLVAWLMQSWHWVSLCAGFGLLAWFYRDGLTRAQILIIGLAATGIVSFLAQNKGFGYHLGTLPPATALFVAAGLDALARCSFGAGDHGAFPATAGAVLGRCHRLVCLALFVVTLGLVALGASTRALQVAGTFGALKTESAWFEPRYDGYYRPYWVDVERVVAAIRAGSNPDEYVLQWGRYFEIPYLAERRPVFRFVSTPALSILSERFSYHDEWLDEIARAFEQRPPVFVVLDVRQEERIVLGNITPAEQIVADAVSGFSEVMRTQHLVLLEAP